MWLVMKHHNMLSKYYFQKYIFYFIQFIKLNKYRGHFGELIQTVLFAGLK